MNGSRKNKNGGNRVCSIRGKVRAIGGSEYFLQDKLILEIEVEDFIEDQ